MVSTDETISLSFILIQLFFSCCQEARAARAFSSGTERVGLHEGFPSPVQETRTWQASLPLPTLFVDGQARHVAPMLPAP